MVRLWYNEIQIRLYLFCEALLMIMFSRRNHQESFSYYHHLTYSNGDVRKPSDCKLYPIFDHL